MESNAPVPPPPPESSLFEMEIDALAQNRLNSISNWGKFIAITSFVLLGLCVLMFAIQYNEVIDAFSKLFAIDSTASSILITILAVFCGVALLLLIFLLRASIMIKRGLQRRDSDLLAEGFKSFKTVFIIGIIFSCLSLLGTLSSFTK